MRQHRAADVLKSYSDNKPTESAKHLFSVDDIAISIVEACQAEAMKGRKEFIIPNGMYVSSIDGVSGFMTLELWNEVSYDLWNIHGLNVFTWVHSPNYRLIRWG